jgi:hypothetical protein
LIQHSQDPVDAGATQKASFQKTAALVRAYSNAMHQFAPTVYLEFVVGVGRFGVPRNYATTSFTINVQH